MLGQDQLGSKDQVKVKNADNFIAERIDGIDHQYFRGNVKMFHDSIFMYADSTFLRENEMTSVGEVIIIQEDTINVFADSLYYNSDTKQAQLFDNVVLSSDDRQLFTNRLNYNLESKIAIFQDTAILKRSTMTLSSLKGVYNLNQKRAKFIDQVVIVDGDFKLTSDSLDYDTDIDRAYFLGPTYINEAAKKIYCEDGYYDLEAGKAYFTKNAKIKDGARLVIADDMVYNAEDSLFVLEGGVEVFDSLEYTSGDKIIINEHTDDVQILGNGYYRDQDKEVKGPDIRYNKTTEQFKTIGRSAVDNESGVLLADTIFFDKLKDSGVAKGEVLFRDTIENRRIYTDELEYSDKVGLYKAYKKSKRPLFQQEIDTDSLFLSADTLVSLQKEDSLSYVKAVNTVRIYKQDLQAICDSLYYAKSDSLFTLYGSPICWSDSTMISGDTIVIKLKDDKVSEIIAKSNGFIITEKPGGYYDQVKGRLIHSYLDSGKVDEMFVKGNAESIYMIQDEEKAYVGPNHTLCSSMTFYFKNEELDNIKFYTEPDSKMTPMSKAKNTDFVLEGFFWDESERPTQISDLPYIGKLSERPKETEQEPLDVFESAVKDILGEDSLPAVLDTLDSSNLERQEDTLKLNSDDKEFLRERENIDDAKQTKLFGEKASSSELEDASSIMPYLSWEPELWNKSHKEIKLLPSQEIIFFPRIENKEFRIYRAVENLKKGQKYELEIEVDLKEVATHGDQFHIYLYDLEGKSLTIGRSSQLTKGLNRLAFEFMPNKTYVFLAIDLELNTTSMSLHNLEVRQLTP